MPVRFLISEGDRQRIGAGALAVLAQQYSEAYFPTQNIAVEISCVDRREMQALNQKYREVNQPTDVLSFPLFANLKEIRSISDSQELLLGSVFLLPEKAEAYQETLPQLVHHGLLHLLGFDHEQDFLSWQKAERAILERLRRQNLNIPEVQDDTL